MSIQHTVTLYGPELARALAGDSEEMAYFLKTLAEDYDPADIAEDIADELSNAEEIATFLRRLADALHPEGATE